MNLAGSETWISALTNIVYGGSQTVRLSLLDITGCKATVVENTGYSQFDIYPSNDDIFMGIPVEIILDMST